MYFAELPLCCGFSVRFLVIRLGCGLRGSRTPLGSDAGLAELNPRVRGQPRRESVFPGEFPLCSQEPPTGELSGCRWRRPPDGPHFCGEEFKARGSGDSSVSFQQRMFYCRLRAAFVFSAFHVLHETVVVPCAGGCSG